MLLALIMSLAMSQSGCSLIGALLFAPGGGGSQHNPPIAIAPGEKTRLELTVSVWGRGSGDIEDRYEPVFCHYRLRGQPEFKSQKMRPVDVQDKRMTLECILPPFEAGAGEAVEYYFDFYFDGHYNQRSVEAVPLRQG
jgi:hypothetical protein